MGLKTRLHELESNGQSLSEVLKSTRSNEGLTMFLVACEHGRLDIAEFLLEHGSMIDERSSGKGDNDCRTGLHFAAQKGHLHIVNRLIELGASVIEKDDYSSSRCC